MTKIISFEEFLDNSPKMSEEIYSKLMETHGFTREYCDQLYVDIVKNQYDSYVKELEDLK